MLCPRCNAPVPGSFNYCPSCGTSLSNTQTTSASPISEIDSGMPKKRRMPLWFKILLTLAVIGLIGVTAGILFTESLVDVIDRQLDALRRSDLDAAYRKYTSEQFRETTSPEEFREFIHAYPVLVTNRSAHFTGRSIENNIGTLTGNLTLADHTKVPIEYKLIKEHGKWKILGIALLEPEKQERREPPATPELISLVKSQLESIRENKIDRAYLETASKEFKDSTSPEAFQAFITRYPILSDYDDISFNPTTMRKGVGIVSAVLTANDTTAFVKYYLIKEEGAWKIWSMRILSPSEQEDTLQPVAAEEKMNFTRIVLGNQIEPDGTIKIPSTLFRKDSGEIYSNVYVSSGIVGETVYLHFQHIASRSSILAKVSIAEAGESMIVSVFSPPIGGWPSGEYRLLVSSSQNSKSAEFSVE